MVAKISPKNGKALCLIATAPVGLTGKAKQLSRLFNCSIILGRAGSGWPYH